MFKETPDGATNFDPVEEYKARLILEVENMGAGVDFVRGADEADKELLNISKYSEGLVKGYKHATEDILEIIKEK